MQKLKPLTLRRNFSWTFAGNVVYGASQWGMLVVLAKLGNPEMVGQFTLGFAVTAPVVMFTNLQLRLVQATDSKHQYFFGDYLGLRLISTALALLVIAAITLVAGYRWEISLVILLVGLAKAFESISDVFYGLLQQHERMERIALSLMIKGPLSLLLLGLGVYLSGQVVWGVVGLVFAWAVVLFSYDIPSGKSLLNYLLSTSQSQALGERQLKTGLLRPSWHLGTLKKLVWLALPLGFVMMLVSLSTNIPRYFIEQYFGERELGIFAAIAYLMIVGNKLESALGESTSPRLAKYYAAGNGAAFRTLLLKLVGIGIVLGGAGVLLALVAGKEILTVLYQREYAQHTDLFVWLMATAAIDYITSFMCYGIMAARYFRILVPLYTLRTINSAISCLWLLPPLGLKGAAIALLATNAVHGVISVGIIAYALSRLPKHKTEASEL